LRQTLFTFRKHFAFLFPVGVLPFFPSLLFPASFCGAFPLGIAVDSVLPGEGKPGRHWDMKGGVLKGGGGEGGVEPQRKWHKLCYTLGAGSRRYLPPNAFLTKQFFILLLDCGVAGVENCLQI